MSVPQQPSSFPIQNDRAWMNSNYWRAIESGSMHYVDDDDLVTLQSNRNYYSEFWFVFWMVWCIWFDIWYLMLSKFIRECSLLLQVRPVATMTNSLSHPHPLTITKVQLSIDKTHEACLFLTRINDWFVGPCALALIPFQHGCGPPRLLWAIKAPTCFAVWPDQHIHQSVLSIGYVSPPRFRWSVSVSVSCGSRQMLIRVPYSRSTDSRMITVNHEPLTETSEENFEVPNVFEQGEGFPDIEEVVVMDRPEVSKNEGVRKSSQCIELQKLLKALNDLNNGTSEFRLNGFFMISFRSRCSRWSLEWRSQTPLPWVSANLEQVQNTETSRTAIIINHLFM